MCFIATVDSIVIPSSGTPWVTRMMANCVMNFTLFDVTPIETCNDNCYTSFANNMNYVIPLTLHRQLSSILTHLHTRDKTNNTFTVVM